MHGVDPGVGFARREEERRGADAPPGGGVGGGGGQAGKGFGGGGAAVFARPELRGPGPPRTDQGEPGGPPGRRAGEVEAAIAGEDGRARTLGPADEEEARPGAVLGREGDLPD